MRLSQVRQKAGSLCWRPRPQSGRTPCGRVCTLATCALFCLAGSQGWWASHRKVSRFGEYRGFAEAAFHGFHRASQYVPVRDGTCLAVDILYPGPSGPGAAGRFPLIWKLERYHRSHFGKSDGRVTTALESGPWLSRFLESGYAVGVVDVRGTGASFGTWPGPFSPVEALDAYDMTEWFAHQPWCNGRIGMFGSSYCGTVQFSAASEAPPHLRAICPEMAAFDVYDFLYGGGVFKGGFARGWQALIDDLPRYRPVVAVDGGRAVPPPVLAGQALNPRVDEVYKRLPYRDSLDGATQTLPYRTSSPSGRLPAIARSRVPVFIISGFFDIWTRDAFLWYANLPGPKRLVVGAWAHTQRDEDVLTAERLRWFDHWLKGIDNGVMEEPPIHYQIIDANRGPAWMSAAEWPPPGVKSGVFFLHARGRSGTGGESLSPSSPIMREEHDQYAVDRSATSGQATRWVNGRGGPFHYEDMAQNDRRCCVYTSRPLLGDLDVIGHPIVHLWVGSSTEHQDFFAYLEEVDPRGVSAYVSEGALRVGFRDTHPAPFHTLGLPYHRCYRKDFRQVGASPLELTFGMHPTAKRFRKGSRIQLSIACADRGNADPADGEVSGVVRIVRGTAYPSRLALPLRDTSRVLPSTGTHAPSGRAASRSALGAALSADQPTTPIALPHGGPWSRRRELSCIRPRTEYAKR